jgi:hypothetical protein
MTDKVGNVQNDSITVTKDWVKLFNAELRFFSK